MEASSIHYLVCNAANSYLLSGTEVGEDNRKKNLKSKPGRKFCKKRRVDIPSLDENDEALDAELLALVASIDTNKSFDSDSSTCSLIGEETNSETISNDAFVGSKSLQCKSNENHQEIDGFHYRKMSSGTNRTAEKMLDKIGVETGEKRKVKFFKRNREIYCKSKANENLQYIDSDCCLTEGRLKAPDCTAENRKSQSTGTDCSNKLSYMLRPILCRTSNNLICKSDFTSKSGQSRKREIRNDCEKNPPHIIHVKNKDSEKLISALPSLDQEAHRKLKISTEIALQKCTESLSSKSHLRIAKNNKKNEPVIQSTALVSNMVRTYNYCSNSAKPKKEYSLQSSFETEVKREKEKLQNSNSLLQVIFLETSKNNNLGCSNNVQTMTTEKAAAICDNEERLQNFNSNPNSLITEYEQNFNLRLEHLSKGLKVVETSKSDVAVNNRIKNIQNYVKNSMAENNSLKEMEIRNECSARNTSNVSTLEMSKSLAQSPQSKGFDKIALSIKKEFCKSISSNYHFTDQRKIDDVKNKIVQKNTSNLNENLVEKNLVNPINLEVFNPLMKELDDDEMKFLKESRLDSNGILIDIRGDIFVPDSLAKKQDSFDENNFVSHLNVQNSAITINTERGSIAQLKTTQSNSSLKSPEDITSQFGHIMTHKENKNNIYITDQPAKDNLSFENQINIIDKNESSVLHKNIKGTLNEFEAHYVSDKAEKKYPGITQVYCSKIAEDKYINEYFKYPISISKGSYYSKQRNKKKAYTRNHSNSWTLSFDTLEFNLKLSEIYESGMKFNDSIELEEYTVSESEVECYRRILESDPSNENVSKCLKSSKKE